MTGELNACVRGTWQLIDTRGWQWIFVKSLGTHGHHGHPCDHKIDTGPLNTSDADDGATSAELG